MDAPRQRPLKIGLYPLIFEHMESHDMPSWADITQLVTSAEDAGFDSVWVGDHPYMRFPDMGVIPVWDGPSLLTAIAATTRRIEIGTLVACTGFRNPAMLAKMAVTVDEISGGRLILGLGAGWHDTDFQATGHPFDHRVSRFEEALTIVKTLLREGEVDFDGTYYQAREAVMAPRGPRPDGIPIVIGSQGERMTRLAARHADAWNRDFNPDNEIGQLGEWQAKVDAACRDAGRDPATLDRYAAVLIDLPIGSPREGWGALTGSPEELAESLRAYANAGISHVQVWLEPSTPAGIESFAKVLELLDAG